MRTKLEIDLGGQKLTPNVIDIRDPAQEAGAE